MNRIQSDELHDVPVSGRHPHREGEGGSRRRRYARPPVDVYSTETEMVVLVDMPGVRKADLDITLERDELIIEGKSAGREETESGLPWGYYRRFTLRTAFDRERIRGQLENGILTITLPKAVSERTRKISIG